MVVVAGFSGLKIHFSKNKAEAQIQYINAEFEQRKPALMKETLLKCEGDISNSDVFNYCLQKHQREVLAPLEAQHTKATIYGYLWVLFWTVFAIFAYSFTSAHFSPKQLMLAAFEILKRITWNTINPLYERFFKK